MELHSVPAAKPELIPAQALTGRFGVALGILIANTKPVSQSPSAANENPHASPLFRCTSALSFICISLERRRSPGHRSRGISSASTAPAKEGDRDPESPPGLREMGEVVCL